MIKTGLEGGRTDWRAQKMLSNYDEALVAKWIKEKQRWGIFTKDRKGKEYLVFIVSNRDGTYRNLDRRDLKSIVKADLSRKARSYSLWKEIEAHNEGLEASQLKQLREDAMAISRERWRHTVGHPQIQSGFGLERIKV